MIETLDRYLEISDDEGNAYGMLARAYERTGNRDKAKEIYQRGIDAALAHGHPSMAEEYRMTLSNDYED
jgi:predicted Zn-dependent protease